MTSIPQSKSDEWRANWPLPLVAAAGYATGLIHLYGIGVFVEPLEQSFGWTRADVTSGNLIISIVFLLLGPFAGVLLNRVGPRRMALPGILAYCGAIAALSLTGPSPWTWRALWVLIGISALTVQAAVWTAAVAGRFERSRGLAMAITLSGGGIGSAVTPVLGNFYIGWLGWRGAFVALGATYAVIAFPLLLAAFRDGGVDRRAKAKTVVSASAQRADIARAMLSSQYVRLSLVSLLAVGTLSALIVHLIPMLDEGGLDRAAAAKFAGLIGIGSIIARLVTGLLLDRFNAALIGFVTMMLPATACALLWLVETSPGSAAFVSLLLGMGIGAEIDVIALMTSRFFGPGRFGFLFTQQVVIQTIAGGLGPILVGIAYDRIGGYATILAIMTVFFTCSALLLGSIRRAPAWVASEAI